MYEKILKKERHTHQISNNQKENSTPSLLKDGVIKKDTVYIKENEGSYKTVEKPRMIPKNDSIAKMQPIGDTLWIENDKYLCGISEIGAKIISLKMKNYYYAANAQSKDSIRNYIDLVANSELGGGNLMINGQDYDGKKFVRQIKEKRILLSKSENKTIDFLYSGEGKNEIVKRYEFFGDSYKIGINIINSALDGKSIVVGWKAGIGESENQATNGKSAAGVS